LEEYLRSHNLIPLFLESLSDDSTSSLSAECRDSVFTLLSQLPRTMINLNMLGPLSEMMLRGSRELRFFCADIYLNIWERDHTLFTADLQTLQLLGSFIPDNPTGRYFVLPDPFIWCLSWMVENVSDYQLLIDSNLLKDLLRIDRREVVEFFSKILRESISSPLLRYLVDDVGVLPYVVQALSYDSWWNDDDYGVDNSARMWGEIIVTVRDVMRSDERYKEMVSQMEMSMSEGVKANLMRGMQEKRKQGKRKRKRSRSK
jgi:hypothetical protein